MVEGGLETGGGGGGYGGGVRRRGGDRGGDIDCGINDGDRYTSPVSWTEGSGYHIRNLTGGPYGRRIHEEGGDTDP